MAVPSTPGDSQYVTAAEFARVVDENEQLRAEVRRLRAIEQRVTEAHAKAESAVAALAVWESTTDEPARTVLFAKWGSAMFYRDKLAHILGRATDGGA